MLYRNIKTGIEFESSSAITAPNIVIVGAVIPTTIEEPSKAPLSEEVKEEEKPEPKALVKKAEPSKAKPKKPVKRTKR